MRSTAVQVPAPVLLDRSMAGSAKLLWIILQIGSQGAPGSQAPVSTRDLEARAGLGLNTVKRGLVKLESAGWLSSTPMGGQSGASVASMPYDLLLDKDLGVQAKLLYGILQLTPARGQTTYDQLCGLSGLSHKTVRAAVQDLQAQGWLQLSQRTKFRAVRFALRNPVAARREGDVTLAGLRLREAPHLGEALMREYLSLLVESDEFEDNATPGFLVNPYTDEELQFDRYYPPRVAFEFNGQQHYRPTALYAKKAEVSRQQGRDLIKTGICLRRGVTLVVVLAEDLSLESMRQKVTTLLPLRRLDGHGPLIDFLEDEARAYRRRAGPTHGAERGG
jgi:hypothetical protein